MRVILVFLTFLNGIVLYAFSTTYSIDNIYPYTESNLFKNQRQLAEIIENHEIKVIVEVGTYMGESAIFMAKLLPYNGKLYAVDSWIGYPIEQYSIKRNFYHRFLSNVIHAECTDKIIPIHKTSLTVSRIFHEYEKEVDLIYIDADHSYLAVYCDILAWSQYIRKGGILCGNLYSKFGQTKEIIKAVVDYCKNHNKKPIFDKSFWMIEP